jgi:hypothetical protein
VVTILAANAGPDQLACSLNPVQLAGTVTAATGGIWSGGAGIFSPANTDLNAVYTPTAAELLAGSVKLSLTSTSNGSCTAVQDEVVIRFYQVEVALTGTALVCLGTSGSVTAAVSGATLPFSYNWNTGETGATIRDKPPGTYTVTISDGNGCVVLRSFSIGAGTGPSDLAAVLQPSTCANNDGRILVGAVTGGLAPYTYSINGSTFQAATDFSGLAAGTYTLQAKDASGCMVSTFVPVGKNGPASFISSTTLSTCWGSNGSLTITSVTGGEAPFTYSKDGTTFQASASFDNLLPGTFL